MNLKLISYSATQPNTGGAAAAFTGDSLTIENSKSPAQILAIWGNNQVEGYHQIYAPSWHDTTRGWRSVVEALEPDMRKPLQTTLLAQPQETLNITIAGSNTSGDVETGHILLWYPDLPGVNMRGLKWAEVLKRGITDTTIQATITGSGAGYSGSELINAEVDLLRANRDYAVVGIETATNCGAVCLLGTDTGNVRVGVPGANTHSEMTSRFFGGLSSLYDLPCVPVINSGNKNSTYLSVAANENAGATLVSVNLVLLD